MALIVCNAFALLYPARVGYSPSLFYYIILVLVLDIINYVCDLSL